MGTISKLSNGKYKATVYDVHGMRHRKTFNKKAEADVFVSKLEAEKNDRKLVGHKLKKARYSMDHEIDNFMLSKSDLRPKTVQKYKNFIKQFKAFCNALKLNFVDEFTPEIANIFYKELNRVRLDPKGSTDRMLKPKPRTINYYLRVARTFFTEQVTLNHIEKNPMFTVKNLRVEKEPPEYYSSGELEAFFAQNMHTAYKNAFMVLLHTGMRFEEMANLSWEDIDFTKRLIYVRPKENFKTKTYRSIRSIPMNNSMVELFKKLSKSKQNEKIALCSIEGFKLRERKLYYICNKFGKAASLKGKINLHKFRHTFATQLVQNNTRIEVVQKLLGHTSIKETMIYAHIKSDELHNEIGLLDQLFVNVGNRKNIGPNLGTKAKKGEKID